MAVLTLVITDAGRQALVDAQNTGTLPLQLSEIALGSGLYNPTPDQTALQAEIKRLATFGAEVVDPATIHVTITDESADTYTLGEYGLYTAGGVLFGVYSQASPILEKAANAMALLAVDVVFTSVDPGSVTIGDTDFIMPPASETRQGIIELATPEEVQDGLDSVRAVTPKGLAARTATETRTGLVELATLEEMRVLTDEQRAATPATVKAVLGNMSATQSLAPGAVTVLDASYTGKLITSQGGTITLPLAADVPNGSAIVIRSSATTTVNTAGADLILIGTGSETTMPLGPGDSVVFVRGNSERWEVSAGSAMLPFSNLFSNSHALNGYQKLPSGLIIQWGETGGFLGNTVGATSQAFTFPLAFPTTCLQMATNHGGTSRPLSSGFIARDWGATGFRGYFENERSDQGVSGQWIAIGY